MARFFLCLAAAACCCLVLLPVPPVQGRLGSGLAGGSSEGSRDHTLTGESFTAAEYHAGTTAKAKPAWSLPWTAAAAGRVRPELRSVPGGPDPLHHHGSPWWPELEPTTP